MWADSVKAYFGINTENLSKEQIADIVNKIGLKNKNNPIDGKGIKDNLLCYGIINKSGMDYFNVRSLATTSLAQLLPKAALLKQLQDEYALDMRFVIEARARDFAGLDNYYFSPDKEEMRFLSELDVKVDFSLTMSSTLRPMHLKNCEEESQQLKELLDEGTITQEEFEFQQNKLTVRG